YRVRKRIHQNGGITNAVFSLRLISPFFHVHDDFHSLPGFAAIGTSAQPHVDIALQVYGTFPSYIINSQKGPIGGGRQSWDSIRMNPIISMVSYFLGQSQWLYFLGSSWRDAAILHKDFRDPHFQFVK